jgi:mannitol/fructose-specific phosphotransferase system IIA component (Ntr-type)
MEEVHGATIVVLDTRTHEPATSKATTATPNDFRAPIKTEDPAHKPPVEGQQFSMGMLIDEAHIKIWETPVARDEAIAALVRTACGDQAPDQAALYIKAVQDREEQGSTFFNEGVAFPHARIAGLDQPRVALGLTRKGISDLVTEKPMEFIFLSLTPNAKPEIQIQLLALAARNLQNRYLRQTLQTARTAHEAWLALRSWESAARSPAEIPAR